MLSLLSGIGFLLSGLEIAESRSQSLTLQTLQKAFRPGLVGHSSAIGFLLLLLEARGVLLSSLPGITDIHSEIGFLAQLPITVWDDFIVSQCHDAHIACASIGFLSILNHQAETLKFLPLHN